MLKVVRFAVEKCILLVIIATLLNTQNLPLSNCIVSTANHLPLTVLSQRVSSVEMYIYIFFLIFNKL